MIIKTSFDDHLMIIWWCSIFQVIKDQCVNHVIIVWFSDKCYQWNCTTFLHRVSGWQFGKTKSYHHTSTQTKFWKCKDWVDADIYKLTVHQHTCVCHHLHLQSFMDIDLLLFRSQWDQTAKMVPKMSRFCYGIDLLIRSGKIIYIFMVAFLTVQSMTKRQPAIKAK